MLSLHGLHLNSCYYLAIADPAICCSKLLMNLQQTVFLISVASLNVFGKVCIIILTTLMG